MSTHLESVPLAFGSSLDQTKMGVCSTVGPGQPASAPVLLQCNPSVGAVLPSLPVWPSFHCTHRLAKLARDMCPSNTGGEQGVQGPRTSKQHRPFTFSPSNPGYPEDS